MLNSLERPNRRKCKINYRSSILQNSVLADSSSSTSVRIRVPKYLCLCCESQVTRASLNCQSVISHRVSSPLTMDSVIVARIILISRLQSLSQSRNRGIGPSTFITLWHHSTSITPQGTTSATRPFLETWTFRNLRRTRQLRGSKNQSATRWLARSCK